MPVFEANADPDVAALLKEVLDTQRVGVLATHREGQPHGSLVGFSASDDLRGLYFATPRTTRKYANIQADPRVALIIDDRTREEADFFEATGVTVWGRAAEADKTPSSAPVQHFLARHPYLKEFLQSPQCALVRIEVERYIIVRKFQEVVELRVT